MTAERHQIPSFRRGAVAEGAQPRLVVPAGQHASPERARHQGPRPDEHAREREERGDGEGGDGSGRAHGPAEQQREPRHAVVAAQAGIVAEHQQHGDIDERLADDREVDAFTRERNEARPNTKATAAASPSARAKA